MEPTEALSAAFANVRAVGAEGRGILETCWRGECPSCCALSGTSFNPTISERVSVGAPVGVCECVCVPVCLCIPHRAGLL